MSTKNPLEEIAVDILSSIKERLVGDESHYQRDHGTTEYSSLWSHSVRVALIAHHLALKEGQDATAAVLAALFHDVGKFSGGVYHRDNEAEEERAVVEAKALLTGSAYESLLPLLNQAVLSLYRDNIEPTGIGAILYDADRLDKLGYIGIAQFFSKNALRGNFLDSKLMKKGSIELTYAYHAPSTLKTATARQLATVRSARVRNYFFGLLEEWKEMSLGTFSIQDHDVEGIKLVLVIPDSCRCEARLNIYTDIRESVKCRSAVVKYGCPACKEESEFSFCLPVLPNFPNIP